MNITFKNIDLEKGQVEIDISRHALIKNVMRAKIEAKVYIYVAWQSPRSLQKAGVKLCKHGR